MGSVKMQTRNEGRGLAEWSYLPLSEPRVVAEQIRNRGKLDPAFYPSLTSYETRVDPEQTAGVFQFSEPIICTYIDIDRLIETSGLSPSEMWTVQKIMRGYLPSDLSDMRGRTPQTYEKLFLRAVIKMCRENTRQWLKVHKHRN